MSLVLNEEQLMLKTAAAEYFNESNPVEAFRQSRDDIGVVRINRSSWNEIAELGWSAITVPEDLGGLEFGLTGLGVVCIEAARKLAVTPLQISAGLGVHALMACEANESRNALIQEIISGDKIVNYVPQNLGDLEYSSGSLSGTLKFVAEASATDILLTHIVEDGNLKLAVIGMSDEKAAIQSINLIDYRDYAMISVNGLNKGSNSLDIFSVESSADTASLEDIGAVLTACELYGISRETFERTIAYLQEREQFDQKIGAFQALQHRMAKAYTRLELLKSVVYDALGAIEDVREDSQMAASHAKVIANEASQLITTEAIQMHGGMGITDELDIGLFYKRARVLQTTFGSTSYHKLRFARLTGL